MPKSKSHSEPKSSSESEELLQELKSRSKSKKSDTNSETNSEAKSETNSEAKSDDKSLTFIKLKDDSKTEIKYVYHISDIHIRNTQRHKEYQAVFDRLCEKIRLLVGSNNKSSLIVLTGDIMHTKTKLSPEAFQMAHQLFNSLQQIASVILIPGNHDCNLSNKERLDALSPIVDDLGKMDNLYYLKKSGIYQFYNIVFGVTSVFDDVLVSAKKIGSDIWKNIKQKNKYKIALYHGPVHGAKTDVGFRMNNEQLVVDDFDGYSYVMLGDIHKYQYLNDEKTVAYAGSLIQQSYGENIKGHGVLRWDLAEGVSELIEIKNDYGYCTVKIVDGKMIETFIPKKPKIRFILENTNQMAYQEVIKDLEKKYSICEVVKESNFKTKANTNSPSQTKLKTKMSSYSTQEGIIQSYLQKKEIPEDKIETIIGLHKKIYQTILSDKKDQVADPMHNSSKNQKWNLLELKFTNTLSYGKNNVIDFTKYDPNKIIGIMAPNHYGKSAILDIILFCLFDKCSRGDRRDILNKNEKNMYCSLLFSIGSKKYLIERIGVRNKNGLTVKIDVNFFSISTDKKGSEVREKLNGIDKNDTNRKISSIIGDYNDYLTTCFSLQNGKNSNFIDMTQLQKKEYLNEILKLNVFEDCHNLAKEKLKKLSTELKFMEQSNIIDLPLEKKKMKKLSREIKQLDNEKNYLEELISMLEISIDVQQDNSIIKYNELSEYNLSSDSNITDTIETLQIKLEKISKNENLNMDTNIKSLKTELELVENEEYYEQNMIVQNLVKEKEILMKKLVSIPKKIDKKDVHTNIIEESTERIRIIDEILTENKNDQMSEKINRIDVLKEKILAYRKSLKPVNICSIEEMDILNNKLVENETIFVQQIDDEFAGNLSLVEKRNLKNTIKLKKSFAEHITYAVDELNGLEAESNSVVGNIIDHHCNWTAEFEQWLESSLKQLKTKNELDIDNIIICNRQLQSSKLDIAFNKLINLDNEIISKKIAKNELELDSLMEFNGTRKEIDNLKQEKKLLGTKIEIAHKQINEISKIEKQIESNTNIQQLINDLDARTNKILENISSKADKISEIKKQIKKYEELVSKNKSNIKLAKKYSVHLQYLTEYQLHYLSWSLKDQSNKKLQSKKKEIDAELTLVNKEYHKKSVEYQLCKSEIESYLKVRKEFDARSDITNDYQLYVQTMNYNGLPYEILKTYLPLIESDINSILHSMVDFDIAIMFYDESNAKEQKTKQLKSNKGSVDINICYHDMKPYNVQLASGFEKFIIGLAIRMTLCQISLTSKPNFLIIDEGWSCLDSDNLNNIGPIMSYIKTQYEHVMIISHLDEMKDQADYVINIDKKDGYSYINLENKMITSRKSKKKIIEI